MKMGQWKGKTLAHHSTSPSGYARGWEVGMLGKIMTPIALPLTCKGDCQKA